MHFPFRALAGNSCFVHSTSDSQSHYFRWKWGWSPRLLHGNELSTCTKAEVWAIFRSYRISSMMLPPSFAFQCGLDGCKSNSSPSHIGEVSLEFYSLALSQSILIAFSPCVIWKASDASLKQDVSIQSPPTLSPPCLGVRSSWHSASVHTTPSPSVELHPGTNLACCTCLEGPKG